MAVKATKSLSRLSPPVSSKEPQAFSASSTPCNPQSCTRWWPDSGSRDFEANAAVILVLLFSFLVCAMSLGAAIRCFLRGEGRESPNRICLSEFVEGEEIYVLDICNHGFHVQCIQQWLSSRFSCPICRSNILSSSPLLKQDPSSCLSSNSPVVLPTRNP